MATEKRLLIYFDELVMTLARQYRKTMDARIYSPQDILDSMQGIRPVDAVEVVRCRACEHYVPPDDGDNLGLCKNGRLAVSHGGEVYPEGDYYCPYGKRRTR